MHLLESLTFVSEIQDAVVEEFRTTLRMFLGEFAETSGKLVAHVRHRPPPRGNFFEIVLLANAQGDRPINAEKMLLQIAGFSSEGRAEISGYFAQPSFRFLESCARQLQNVRGIKTCAHLYTTVIQNYRMPQDLYL